MTTRAVDYMIRHVRLSIKRVGRAGFSKEELVAECVTETRYVEYVLSRVPRSLLSRPHTAHPYRSTSPRATHHHHHRCLTNSNSSLAHAMNGVVGEVQDSQGRTKPHSEWCNTRRCPIWRYTFPLSIIGGVTSKTSDVEYIIFAHEYVCSQPTKQEPDGGTVYPELTQSVHMCATPRNGMHVTRRHEKYSDDASLLDRGSSSV